MKSPRLLLRLRRQFRRFGGTSAEADRQRQVHSEWHAMLQRAEAEDRDRRLAAAEAALNRLGRTETH